jgi:hypothetical protein
VVEGYPQDLPQGKKISSSFLYNVTRSLYEQTGFSYDRPKGKNHCVMRRNSFSRQKASTHTRRVTFVMAGRSSCTLQHYPAVGDEQITPGPVFTDASAAPPFGD